MTRVYWHLSEYISHRRAGEAYLECLPLAGLERVLRPEDADVVVLHEDPIFWPELYTRMPVLREKTVAGYAVWETAELPEVYRPGLALVDAVWTASKFSAAALQQGHGRVGVLPHVVRRIDPASDDVAWSRALTGGTPYFFSIIDALNPRKNLEALLRTFGRVRAVAGRSVQLVVKQYREAVLGELDGVLALSGHVPEGRMAALHRGAIGYVSPHRGEAWGLGLSEAMSHALPVLATGWSGNMDFMDGENSVPLRFRLEAVGERMSTMLPHFRPDMVWAAVDEGHLEREMLRLVRRGPDRGMCVRARAITERFSAARVARILGHLIENLG